MRASANWGAGGGWNDATSRTYPDRVQIQFSGQKTIDKVVVFTLQDNYSPPVEPNDAMTFSSHGITGFQVQTSNGSSWVTQATIAGNSLVHVRAGDDRPHSRQCHSGARVLFESHRSRGMDGGGPGCDDDGALQCAEPVLDRADGPVHRDRVRCVSDRNRDVRRPRPRGRAARAKFDVRQIPSFSDG